MVFFVVSYFREFVIKDLYLFRLIKFRGLDCRLLGANSRWLQNTLHPYIFC
jgi:hypothetical protein